MKRPIPAGIATVVAGLLLAGAAHTSSAAGRLNVVTTTTDLKSITESIGGDRVDVTSIARGNQDPHYIAAKPSYMMAARKADLWIRIGLELEIGYERLILDGSRNRRIRIGTRGHLDASQGVLRLEVPHQRVTRAMGDIHPLGNPHYWLDPLNARIMAGTIADRLCELSPQDADVFRDNLEAFQTALDERMFGAELVKEVGGSRLWQLEGHGKLPQYLEAHDLAELLGGWKLTMAPFEGQAIATHHRSWSYFVNRFGLAVAAELEPKPGVPPGPRHLAEVVGLVETEDVSLTMVEPYYNRKAADFVSGKTGATVVVCANSVGGQPEATDYLALMDLIVGRVSAALGGVQGAPSEKTP